MHTSIKEFLKDQTVATICFVDKSNLPYCINCFYLFQEENALLIFKSSFGTSHDQLVLADSAVAGTILPHTFEKLKIKGLQFSGKILAKSEIDRLKLSSQYTKKYPFSLTLPGYIWGIKLEKIKYTNNTLGFGNKQHWTREEKS